MISAQEVAEAFNRCNAKATWSARPNSRDGRDLVIFHSPSDLVELAYESTSNQFLVRFLRAEAPFRTYVLGACKAFSYIVEVLAFAGMPFAPPNRVTDVALSFGLTGKEAISVSWPGLQK